jgi:hypothetical protein
VNQLVVADKLNLALIETPEQGAQFVKTFHKAVAMARAVGAERGIVNKYAEKMVRSVRVTGALIAELPREKGGRGKTTRTAAASFCDEAGISRDTAERWQSVAAIPESEFEARISDLRDSPDPNIFITLSPFYGNKHRNAFTGEIEWYTPAEYIEAARKLMGSIDLDPATSEAAQKTVRAKQYFTESGLEQEWGGRVWLNPPYGQAIAEFVTRLVVSVASRSVTEAVLLTHNSCDTAWWHEAHGACTAFMHTRGRVNFERSDGFTASPPLGQTFFYFGKRAKSFAARFSEFGCISFPLKSS